MGDSLKIHEACDNGDVDIVRLLLGEKCNIEACDKNDQRPIHIACASGHVDIVKLLLAMNCDIKACDKENKTPLDIATQINNEELISVVKLGLLKRNIIEKMRRASEIQCEPGCNHKSCSKDLMPTDPEKKIVIGRGAFGKVYKITDPETNLDYAMKSIDVSEIYITKEDKSLEDDVDKYRELLTHPRIVEYYGSMICAPKIFIFMEYVPRGSLYTAIWKRGAPMPHELIIGYAKQIFEGLEFLHEKKVMHRNIKPQNILMFDNDCIKISGFGLSKLIKSTSQQSEADTDNGKQNDAKSFCGTVYYMAPEVILGEGYGLSVDVWSVGSTIVHMLTGKPPYYDMPEPAVMFRIATVKKIIFEPREKMGDNFKLFLEEIFNPDPIKRLTPTELLKFLNDHDMTK